MKIARNLDKKIQKSINTISKERDNLRFLIMDIDEVTTECEEAIDLFNEGLDKLSKYL